MDTFERVDPSIQSMGPWEPCPMDGMQPQGPGSTSQSPAAVGGPLKSSWAAGSGALDSRCGVRLVLRAMWYAGIGDAAVLAAGTVVNAGGTEHWHDSYRRGALRCEIGIGGLSVLSMVAQGVGRWHPWIAGSVPWLVYGVAATCGKCQVAACVCVPRPCDR